MSDSFAARRSYRVSLGNVFLATAYLGMVFAFCTYAPTDIDGVLFAPALVGAALGTLVTALRFPQIHLVLRGTIGGAFGGAICMGGTLLVMGCRVLVEGHLNASNLNGFISDFIAYSFIGCLAGAFVGFLSSIVYGVGRFTLRAGPPTQSGGNVPPP